MPTSSTASIKEQFQLDPSIHFLNHGSFGACPIPVFKAYQDWQSRLERQPVQFLGREYAELLKAARQALAAYFNSPADDLVFVPNATYGVNIVARSLDWHPDDEILSTDHEYGACNNIWDFICRESGVAYKRQHLALPVRSEAELLEKLWSGVNARTRLIFLSHITSPTALRLPVEAVCARARAAGILTLVDGAHAPGQTPLDLPAVGADFYTGNCHKWLMAPKGAGFLYARPEVQRLIEPLVVSWGYSATPETTRGSRFLDLFEWAGTADPAAYLAVPEALRFMAVTDWEVVSQRCHNLLRGTLPRLSELTGLPMLYPADSDFYRQMAVAQLPATCDTKAWKQRLYDEFRIEVPLTEWNGWKFVRLSVQGYNSAEDLDCLVEGLRKLIAD